MFPVPHFLINKHKPSQIWLAVSRWKRERQWQGGSTAALSQTKQDVQRGKGQNFNLPSFPSSPPLQATLLTAPRHSPQANSHLQLSCLGRNSWTKNLHSKTVPNSASRCPRDPPNRESRPQLLWVMICRLCTSYFRSSPVAWAAALQDSSQEEAASWVWYID